MRCLVNCLLISLILLLSLACKENEGINPIDRVGYSYYPISLGNSWVYEVERITTTPIVDSVIENFYIKEELVDAYLNVELDSTFIIYRSKKELLEDSWEFLEAWSLRRTANQLIKIENNTPLIKLSFPIKDKLVWNGNALNSLEQDEYSLGAIGTPYMGINEDFANSLTVTQAEGDDRIIFFDLRKEIYAINVGLVYKEVSQIVYCNDSESGCFGMEIIENSFSEKMELLEFEIN